MLSNIHLPNFIKGGIYQGDSKAVCVPGLNCYSCPAAAGACPIGRLSGGGRIFEVQLLVLRDRVLDFDGRAAGTFRVRFLCPFGWLQELLHKIPGKKLSTGKLKPLRYVKYGVLALTVVLLPAVLVNDVGMGDPLFCKYICPQGVLEGAIPLSLVDSGIRSALGALFTWKLAVLIAVVVLSVLFYRPFCKWVCPLGAFYALMNKVSLLGMKVDPGQMHLLRYVREDLQDGCRRDGFTDHAECIRCGMCVNACPVDATAIASACARHAVIAPRRRIGSNNGYRLKTEEPK